jgi:PKD repeat protein
MKTRLYFYTLVLVSLLVTAVSAAAPVANFNEDITNGVTSLTVHFTDTSTNSPTTWEWHVTRSFTTFNDTPFSTQQNPTHTFPPGEWDVSLYASNGDGGSWKNKTYDQENRIWYIYVWDAGTNLSTSLDGMSMMPPNSIYNTPIDKLPLMPNSADITGVLTDTTHWWDGEELIVLDNTTGITPQYMTSLGYGGYSSDDIEYYVPSVIRRQTIDNTDQMVHVCIKSLGVCDQFYQFAEATDGSWNATVADEFDMTSYSTRLTETWNKDLPEINGFLRYEEVASGEPINHALNVMVPKTNASYVFPYRYYLEDEADSGPQYPPIGARFRLKSSVDISGWEPESQRIGQALKTYGGWVSDSHGSTQMVQIVGVDDSRWCDAYGVPDCYLKDLLTLTGTDWEVVNTSMLMINNTTLAINQTVWESYGYNEAPLAQFDVNTSWGYIPASIEFTDYSTGGPTSWNWSFGDGDYSTEQNPVHVYEIAGYYEAQLNTTNAFGSNVSEVRWIYIYTPRADIGANQTNGPHPLSVQFYDNSDLPDYKETISWNWSFGDGDYSTEQYPIHTYPNIGSYTVTFNVTIDGVSYERTRIGYINVRNPAPYTWIKVSDPSGDGDAPVSLVTYEDGSGDAIFGGGSSGYTSGNLLKYNISLGRWSTVTESGVSAGRVIGLTTYDDGTGNAIFGTSVDTSLNKYNISLGDWIKVADSFNSNIYYYQSLVTYNDGSGNGVFTIISNSSLLKYNTTLANWLLVSPPPSDSPVEGLTSITTYDDGTWNAIYAASYNYEDDSYGGRLFKFNNITNEWLKVADAYGAENGIEAITIYDDGTGNAIYGLTATAGNISSVGGYLLKYNATTGGWLKVADPVYGVTDEVSSLTSYNDGSGWALFIGDSSRAGTLYKYNTSLGTWFAVAEPLIPEQNYMDMVIYNDGSGNGLYASALWDGSLLKYNATVPVVTIPVASFTSNATGGFAPRSVQLTDTSSNSPTSWDWSYTNVSPGNDTEIWFSTEQNPIVTFGIGNWSMRLNASNTAGSNVSTQATNIKVVQSGTCIIYSTTVGEYTVDTINNTGDCTWVAPENVISVEYLVVAGGGGGGTGAVSSWGAGAGGAGGFRNGTEFAVTPLNSYDITVGNGGIHGNYGAGSIGNSGTVGDNSSFATIIANGGGGGGFANDHQGDAGVGGDGGSGGGGGGGSWSNPATGGTGNTPATTPSQGNNGGFGGALDQYWGGGGGGAGVAASNQQGGDGLQNNITGTLTYYAGGGAGSSGGTPGLGGGGYESNTTNGSNANGTNGLGGGGGGAYGQNSYLGGHGGSGVVILRYLTNGGEVPSAPVANFTSNVTSGVAPTSVKLTDSSTNSPTSWDWSYQNVTGNNTQIWFSTQQNPSVTFGVGNWSIRLIASNAGGSNISTQIIYINVSAVGGTPTPTPTPTPTQTPVPTPTPNTCGEIWKEQTASANWSSRYGQTGVRLSDDSIVLMGGYANNITGMQPLNDVWRTTDKGVTWVEQTPPITYNNEFGSPDGGGAEWSRRFLHTSVVLPDDSIVLMGGTDGQMEGTVYNDVWRSTDKGATWMEMTPYAEWEARAGHISVALHDGSIVLLSGATYGSNGAGEPYLGDVWRSTNGGATWIEQNSSAFEQKAFSSAVVLTDDTIVVTGGYYHSDTWTLRTTWRSTDKGVTWELQSMSAPWILSGHSSVVLPNNNVLLMGGFEGYITNPEDASGTLFNDMWQSSDKGGNWTKQTITTGWLPRFGHSSVILSDGSILLFGGTDGNNIPPAYTVYNDTWILPACAPAAPSFATNVHQSTYFPHLVRISAMNYLGTPIPDMAVSAVVVESTSPYSWLTDVFGINSNETQILNTTLSGTTDSDGSIAFMMVENLKYRLDFSKPSESISQTNYIYPKEGDYVYVFWSESPPSVSESISIDFWNRTNLSNSDYMDLGVKYLDTGATTDWSQFTVYYENNTILYQKNTTTPNSWNISYPVYMGKGAAYIWGARANNTRYPNQIVQSQIMQFGYSPQKIPFSLGDVWNQWISLGIIGMVALLAGRVSIKYISAIVACLTLFFVYIGWLGLAWLVLSVVVLLGILFYFRYAEGESDI